MRDEEMCNGAAACACAAGEDGGEEADVEEYTGYSAAFARLHNAHRWGGG